MSGGGGFRPVLPLLVVSLALFVAGAALARYVVFPLAWSFMVSFETPPSTGALASVLEAQASLYRSLHTRTMLAFGSAFQLPVLLTLLARAGIVQVAMLRQHRWRAIVIMFVVATIVTPPDIINQLGVAISMILLYEIWIRAATIMGRGKDGGSR